MKQINEKVKNILQNLYNIVISEENGNSERICEYFDSTELKEILEEYEIPIKPMLEDEELEWAIDDYLSEFPEITSFNEDQVNQHLEWVNMNSTDRERFKEKLKQKLG